MAELNQEPPRSARGGSIIRWIIAIVILAAIGFWFFRGRSTQEGGKGGQTNGTQSARQGGGPAGGGGGRGGFGGPIVVTTTNANAGDIGVYVSALGSVTPLSTVAVRSRVEGQLIKIYYTEGQLVKQGDPIAEIDPAPFEASLAQAEGQLARDSASLENAKLDLQRYKDAFARNAVPRQQLDTQTSSVRQFEGAVKFDQGQVDTAKVQLNYCHIHAPVSGRVGLRLVDVGNIVRANDTNALVVITQIKPIAVVFSVAEDHLPKIQKQIRDGNTLTVDAYDRALEHKLAAGKLQTIDNQIDAGTGTVRLKALFENEDEALFPNQFVNARLLVETHRNITLVPNRAIQRGAEGVFVFAIDADGTAMAQPIQVGASNAEFTEAGGLKAGSAVALDNFNRLTDGAKVAVRTGQGGPGGARGPGAGGGHPGGDRSKQGSPQVQKPQGQRSQKGGS